jgi:MFS family permease
MKVAEQRSLTREQKEAVGLLSIGTLLEYFDLMLYVHMAVLLNELFFPKTDPFTASLLSAFAFCSTFVFRPFGALIFGYMGDTMGRRITVVITTIMMAISCIIMAISPTYAEIGITASVIITLCRIIQGLSSMGEVIGAELYVAETIQKPYRYFYVSIIPTLATTGGMLALAVATFVTQYTFNWRYAFWAGAIIALIGTIAKRNS